jgi:thioredoxin reductase (NADPH)
MNFADLASSVTLVVRGEGLAASMSTYLSRRIGATANITVRTQAELVAVDGDDWLRNVTLRDTLSDERCRVDAHAVFICIGGVPHTEWVRRAGLVVDVAGYLVTGRDLLDPAVNDGRHLWLQPRDPYPLESSTAGVFAAGDVRRGSTKRVSAAVGEGAMAVGLVHRFLGESAQLRR